MVWMRTARKISLTAHRPYSSSFTPATEATAATATFVANESIPADPQTWSAKLAGLAMLSYETLCTGSIVHTRLHAMMSGSSLSVRGRLSVTSLACQHHNIHIKPWRALMAMGYGLVVSVCISCCILVTTPVVLIFHRRRHTDNYQQENKQSRKQKSNAARSGRSSTKSAKHDSRRAEQHAGPPAFQRVRVLWLRATQCSLHGHHLNHADRPAHARTCPVSHAVTCASAGHGRT